MQPRGFADRVSEAVACFLLGMRDSLSFRAIATLAGVWTLAIVVWLVIFIVYREQATALFRDLLIAMAKGIGSFFSSPDAANPGPETSSTASRIGAAIGDYSSIALSWVLTLAAYFLAVIFSVRVVCELVLMRWIRQQAEPLYPVLLGQSRATPRNEFALALRNTLNPWVGLLVMAPAMLLVPLLGSVLLFAVLSYLNIRFLINDATDDLATAREVRTFIVDCRVEMILLGLMVTALNFVPLVGFIMPWATGSAACHLAMRYFAAHRTKSQ